ncbi:unannotated protein [freshwater metagenome]|uniref:Unannotated protein n=1 Tax=freshwater metagenome TaxID=449393 RepID=A0A6J7XYB0_9ZZZZ
MEFALVLPLLLLIILSLIDFGRMGFVEVSITSASREGARLSSLYPAGLSNVQPITTLVEAASPGAASISQLDGSATLTTTMSACSTSISSENTSVTVSTPFNWLLPIGLVGIVAPNSTLAQGLTLTSTSSMRCGN